MMAIRTNYKGDPDLQRKIDQHYEMAGLARQDSDKADEKRHMDAIKKLQEQR